VRVDFYQLGGTIVEAAVPAIVAKARQGGARVLVVSADEAQLGRIGDALWERSDAFLAHGKGGEKHAARQPVLLSGSCVAENDAALVAFADGQWRDEGFGFERALLFFGEAELTAARACWRMLGEREQVERRFWKQEGGKWVEGP
jgi:DNA polymerase-3 subunit chi